MKHLASLKDFTDADLQAELDRRDEVSKPDQNHFLYLLVSGLQFNVLLKIWQVLSKWEGLGMIHTLKITPMRFWDE